MTPKEIIKFVVLLAGIDTLAEARIRSQSNDVATKRNDNRELQVPDLGDIQLPTWVDDLLNGGDIDWNSEGAWNVWFDSLMGGAGGSAMDICPLLEAAVGMGEAFGIAANCECNGNLTTTMEISCSASNCVPGNATCGDVALNLTFGLAAGEVATSVCADFPGEEIKETCFSYSMDMSGGSGTAGQTCEASYDGTACDCSIETFCLKIDCSSVLPGAVMDTCQVLNMLNVSDIANFLPSFDILDPGFVFDADMIPWKNLSWDNLDYDNFNVSAVEWSGSDWASKSWTDIIGDGSISPGMCTFLAKSVELTEQLGSLGSCTCNETNGLEMACNFTEVCAETADGLCGTVQMILQYESLSAVDNLVCIDYSEDVHPKTCFSYTIPVAGKNEAPSCNATYGEQSNCKCSIDERLCITVDCSEFEPTAITSTCQYVGLSGQDQANSLMMDFKAPQQGAAVTDGTAAETNETTGEDPVDVTPANSELSGGGSFASLAQLSVASAFTVLFLSIFLLDL